MVITRDYGRLQASDLRTRTSLLHSQQIIDNENNRTTSVELTKNIYAIPKNL